MLLSGVFCFYLLTICHLVTADDPVNLGQMYMDLDTFNDIRAGDTSAADTFSETIVDEIQSMRKKRGVKSKDVQTVANTLGSVGFFDRKKRDLTGQDISNVLSKLDSVDWSHAVDKKRKRRGLSAGELNSAVGKLNDVDWSHALSKRDADTSDSDDDCPPTGCAPQPGKHGVLSNLLGVDRPFGLYGNKPADK